MTKKRTIMSFVLAICLFVPAMFLLSACGGDDKGGNTKGHVHSYVCEVSTDAYLASSATCTQKSKYYYSCSCGEKSDQTFDYGDALGHIGGTASCNVLAVCTRCNESYGEYAEHSFDNGLVSVEPTCTQGGVFTKTCTVCGKKDNTPLPASHKGDWYVTAKARCFDDGMEQRICTVCDTIENRTIPKIGHHELEKATCVAGQKCKNCNYVEGVGTGHVFPTDWTIKAGCAPTCTDSGTEEHACMVCGETEERKVSSLGHTGDWVTTKYATCTKNGQETKTCTRCNALVGTRTIYATGHQGTWNTTLEPTCSATGKATLTCTECYNTVEKTLSKVPHTYGDWQIISEATCYNEHNGQKKRTCSVCGNSDTAIIPYMHSYSIDETNWYREEPTCTKDGKIVKPCYVCWNETAKNITILPKLGHTGDWVITQEATCTEDGIKTQTCTRCNQVTNLTISKLGHDMSAGTCTTLPTCSRCGHTEGEANHDYATLEARVIEEPDCERYGYKILTCSKCGNEKTESIDYLGHKFSESIYDDGWKRKVEPTCTKEGKDRRVCLICNKAYDRRLDKLGHEMVDGNCTTPYHCTRCDYQEFVGHKYGENGCTECGLSYTDVTYELSQDGSYYIVTAINVSGIKDVFIRPTYNSLPVKVIRCTMPSTVETVVLSNNIEVIGENAFNNCTNLTSITLGTGLNKIGAEAFYNCINLKNVLFESLDNWFDIVLENNNSSPFGYGATIYVQGAPISEIIIPDSVTKINDRLFYGCTTITKVTFGSGVESIGEYSFANCSNLTQVIMNNGLKSIGSYAFYNCDGLTTVSIPDSVTKLNNYSFYDCSGLTAITIPDSVVEIGNYTFYQCYNLESITVSPNNANYASETGILYNKEKTQVVHIPKLISGEIVIPAGITKIDMYMFNGCKNITKVTLPETIQYISRCAFEDCTNLESINIPNGVKSIYDQAFKNCTSLKTLSLPATLENIDTTVLDGCSNLESITVANDNQNYSSESGILYNKAKTEINYVPKMISGEIVIPDAVLSIYNKFGGCSKITQLTIGAGVQDSEYNIREKFSWMASLKKIVVSENNALYSSDEYGIQYNKDKTVILNIPRAIEGDIVIADGVADINPSAFKGRTKLTSVVIPNSVTWIGTSAFNGCTGLTSVIMQDGEKDVTYLGNNAFDGCTKLTKIRLSSTLTSISSQVFNNCKSLTSIYIPASVTNIDANDYNPFFNGCSKALKIYCGAESKPDGWGKRWNYCSSSWSTSKLDVEWNKTRADYESINGTQA